MKGLNNRTVAALSVATAAFLAVGTAGAGAAFTPDAQVAPAAVAPASDTPLDQALHINVTPANFDQVMELSNKKLLVFVTTGKFCAFCVQYDKMLIKMVEEDKGNWVLGVVDTDVNPTFKDKWPYKTLAEVVAIKDKKTLDGPLLLRFKWEFRNWVNKHMRDNGVTPIIPDMPPESPIPGRPPKPKPTQTPRALADS